MVNQEVHDELIKKFQATFGAKPKNVAFAPGRIEVLGAVERGRAQRDKLDAPLASRRVKAKAHVAGHHRHDALPVGERQIALQSARVEVIVQSHHQQRNVGGAGDRVPAGRAPPPPGMPHCTH